MPTEVNRITREIEIDAGHRIPNHTSKCRNIHGHRYKIQVTVAGELCSKSGDSEEGMVVDFSFLKESMVNFIHNFCDHTLILWRKDKLFSALKFTPLCKINEKDWKYNTSVICENEIVGRTLMVNFIPTAENLAKYFFKLLEDAVNARNLILTNVRVYETPNCWADYTSEG